MTYRLLLFFSPIILRLWHPIFRISGLENVPKDRNFVICPNHRGMADPFWALMAMRLPKMPRIMAKAQLMRVPLIGAFLRHIGVFGVRRGETDITAIKTSLTALKGGENLLIFPEGTRVKPGKTVEAKSGAVMLAMRTDTPILPVYLETKRHPFSPMRCIIGRPWLPTQDGKPSAEALRTYTQELMGIIYKLGESK